MTYNQLNLVFLAIAVAFFAVVVGTRLRKGFGLARIAQYALTLGVIVALTAVFDNVIIALGIVAYRTSALSGAFIGLIPIEDFAYSLAVVLLAPSLWMLLSLPGEARRDRKTGKR